MNPGGLDEYVSTVRPEAGWTERHGPRTRVLAIAATTLVLLLGLGAPGEAAFPGANGKIAFNTSYFLSTVNPDTTGLTQLTHTAGPSTGFIDRHPAWSSDGTRVVFDSDSQPDRQHEGGITNVWVIKADGSGLAELTQSGGRDPSWSPDGSRITYAGTGGIFVMHADGSGVTQLTNVGSDATPAWSPDGTKIAFTSHRDGNDEVYVMNATGSGQTNLTHNPAADNAPNWSPDGTKIAFTSRRDGNNEVYVMNATGSAQTNLTQNTDRDDSDPAWSPDGTKIAFYSNAISFTDEHVFVMAADGSSPTQLGTFGAAFPDWQPQSVLFAPIRFVPAPKLVTITISLVIPISVGILVQRRVHGRLVTVGRVPFGLKPKGHVHIKWDLRVHGRQLAPGVYLVRVRFLDRTSRPFQVSQQFTVRVPARQ